MKKLLSVLFALALVVSIAGVVYSHQGSYNPQVNDGGAYIAVPVFNNESSTTMDAGDVVVWDISSSTGDNDAYVKLSTTADTGIVAGVVWPSDILAQTSGSMVIWGIVECDIGADGVGADSPICSSATSGGGDQCPSTDGSGSYAMASIAGANGAQIACVVGK